MLAIVTFILATLWLASRALVVGYTANGQSLDGSSAALKHDEAMFARVWGHLRESGVITIHQASADMALSELHKLSRQLALLKSRHLIAGYATPAAILPDSQTVRRRLAAWRAFWNPKQIANARLLLAHAASTHGLRAGAFDTALKSWQSPRPIGTALQRLQQSPAMLFPGVIEMASVKRRMVPARRGRWSALPSGMGTRLAGKSSDIQMEPRRISISSTVELNPQLPPNLATQWATDVRHIFPGISIICGEVLYLNASHHARTEAKNLFPWVALLILVPLWIYFRRLDIAAIASLSLGIGFIWLLGVAQWLGGGLNLLSLVPILFTMGVAVDYGI
ncbi:conserved hypothetical protein, membrane, partial [mine drainage metagenome]